MSRNGAGLEGQVSASLTANCHTDACEVRTVTITSSEPPTGRISTHGSVGLSPGPVQATTGSPSRRTTRSSAATPASSDPSSRNPSVSHDPAGASGASRTTC